MDKSFFPASAVSRPVRDGRSSGLGHRLQQLALELQRRSLSEARVWPNFIELTAEVIDDHLGIDAVLEPLHAQALVTEFPVERLIPAILPRLTWVDVRSIDVCFGEPFQHSPGDKLGAVV